MLQQSVVTNILITLVTIISTHGYTGYTQDETTVRANTLFDDADNIERQLENEAHDKMMYGKPKTIWVFRLPTEFPRGTTQCISKRSKNTNVFKKRKKPKKIEEPPVNLNWNYKDQEHWYKIYPDCGGRSQSPVNLPVTGLINSKGCRQLQFINYEVPPKALTLTNDGRRIVLRGKWAKEHQPLVYGGASHSRRYLFHTLTLHWPSEHRIGGLQYPIESQVIYISAEYKTAHEAVKASPWDHQAFLGIVNLYKYSNNTQQGLLELINNAAKQTINASIRPLPLAYFNPPIKEYACYHGSLTVPPCTESVLWLIRARPLSVTRETAQVANSLLVDEKLRGTFLRQPQSLNDRKVYLFI